MDTTIRKLQLTKADLLGHPLEAVVCDQCSSGCGYRIARVLDGSAFIMCSRKEAAREVLAGLKRR